MSTILLPQTIKAVIFDMDGTIIKTNKLWSEAVTRTMQMHGIDSITPEQSIELRSVESISLHVSLARMRELFDLKVTTEELIIHVRGHAFTLFEEEIEFVEGFEQFHQLLQKHNIPSGIATNADRESLQKLAAKMNFGRFFGGNMYCVNDVNNRPKPDPALFLHTAEQLGVDPAFCLVFEDSIHGFNAARQAGMHCIAIKHAKNHEHVHEAHAAIDSYAEVEHLIKTFVKIL